MKWSDITEETTPDGNKCIRMQIRHSKGDKYNKRGDIKIFKVDKEDKNNPWHHLKKMSRKYPKEIYVFQQKKSEKCYSTGQLVYHLKKATTEAGYKRVYTGHSCRNGVVNALTLAGATDEQLRIFFCWEADSTMTHYYKKKHLENSSIGCAELMSNIIKSGKIKTLQNQLMYS